MTTTLPKSCDLLVIGGGVVGLSVAYELASRQSDIDIVVVDRQTPAQEASWAGAGILPPGSWYDDHPALEQLAAISLRLNHEWSSRLADSTGFDNQLTHIGAVHLAATPGQQERLEAKFDHWQRLDIAVKQIDLDQIRRIEPNLHIEGVLAAYHVPGEAKLDNRWHCRGLAAACKAFGVRICHPVEVRQLNRSGDRVQQVHTTAGTIEVRKIVLAAGAWSPAIAEPLDLRLSVRPMRGQMLSFGPFEKPLTWGIIHRGDQYIVPKRGRLLVGSTVEDVGFDKSTTPDAANSLAEFAHQVMPKLQQYPIADHWAGLRPASADGLPYIGRVPGVHNAFVATGHFRSGLQMASGTAMALADLITGASPRFSLEPFRLDR
ncbi:glycine oxidase ThiO [Aeoliella sp.]|uniref:glycine oxidase ThiO n=1 Tax=Aeoliella sp. TaxID=2795800 RepID=UPI003CCC21A3